MTHSRNVSRWVLAVLVLLALLALQQSRIVRAALPTELFISEYTEGNTGNTKAIEIYNGTGATVTLTGTYNVVLYVNGSATAGTPINLTGSIAAGDVFVLSHTDVATFPAALADQLSGSLSFNGDDAVALRNGTTIVDIIGQTGADPGSQWGTDPVSTQDNTIRRKSTVCAGDTVGSNVFDPSIEWDGFANHTFDGFGSHTANCSGDATPTLSINDVTLAEGDAGTTSFVFTVSLTTPAGAGGVTFDIATADNTATDANNDYEPNTLTSQTIPEGETEYTFSVTVNGDTTAESSESFFVNVTNVTGATAGDVQGLGTITNDDLALVPIHDIQGINDTSPYDGQTLIIEGIVVGDFRDTTPEVPTPSSNDTPANRPDNAANELNGFFVQEEVVDADPNTSEGIFVFEGSNPSTPDVTVGDKVRVTGTVDEFGDAADANPTTPDTVTELVGPLTITIISSGNPLPTAASIDLPVGALSEYEKYESMRVTFEDELTVTEVFTLGRYGEVLLAAGGRLWNPTHEAEPGAPAQAVRDANILRSIVLDDGLTNQNPEPLMHPTPGGLSATNTLRGGDTTTGLTGIMHYLDATEDYRIQPSDPITWNHENPRPTEAPDVGGSLKVVGSNTLNYFTTVDPGPDICGPAGTLDCRGADSQFEFDRQHAKLINMLLELDADIVGLNELENNAAAGPANDSTDPVLESIVTALNDATAPDTYAFIDTGVIGTDVIKVGMIYKPGVVTPVGDFEILDSSVDARFIDTRNRPVLAQTFEDDNGGVFTVAVAHLKSKGSCPNASNPPNPEEEQGDLQGCWNPTRTAAAEAMVDWFDTLATASGDTDILLVGDLNSYVKEDPIDVLVNAGYVDLAAEHNTDPYSYVFDGEWGYLDYAFASPSLADQVTGATEWHVNADEPIVLDYNTEFKFDNQTTLFYSPDPFRVSDHDPMVVGLNLTFPDVIDPDTTITAFPTNPTANNVATFDYESDEGGNQFECELDGDGDDWFDCDDGQYITAALSDSSHTFKVRAIDAAGNVDETPASYTWVIDTVPPTVTINQASGQVDPTSTTPINFTVVFSEPVTGFQTGDVTLDGTAGATTAVVTETGPMDGTTYNVAVSGMTTSGTVIATIAADKAEDAAGNGNTASTSTDNTVDYEVPAAPTEVFVSTMAAGNVGALSFGSEDVLKWDGSAWSVWFDGSDAGLEPAKAKHNLNAIYIPDASGDDLYLSFTQNRRHVPDLSAPVDGMDILFWDGSVFSVYFDGSDVGLTNMVQEKIDALHILPPSAWTATSDICLNTLLISTQGPGKVTNYSGGQLKFSGEDVLAFCVLSDGNTTTGLWDKVIDGSDQGVPKNAISSINVSDDGQTMYLTTNSTFNVDTAVGGHSMVYAYDFVSETFSGPHFVAATYGLNAKVDGLDVTGDLP